MTFLCYDSLVLRPSRSQLFGAHKGHTADDYFSISTLRKTCRSELAYTVNLAFLIHTQTMGKSVWKQFHSVEGLGLFYMLAQLQHMGRGGGDRAPFHSCAL